MAIEILMPALSPTMKQGTLTKWLKKEGETIAAGEVIAEIETDKALMEVEAVDEGTIAKIMVAAGTKNVAVNEMIAILAEEDESTEDAIAALAGKKPVKQDAAPAAAEKTETAKPELKPAPAPAMTATTPASTASSVIPAKTTATERIFASPVAKRIAADKQIDLSNIAGSGPRGRIVKADIENSHTSSSIVNRADSYVEISDMRHVIAERLTAAKQQVPHFYLEITCGVDQLLEFRSQINSLAPKNADGKPSYKISINDLIIKAVGLSLAKHPDVNAAWLGDKIVKFGNIDVAVAVAIDDGLITPIVTHAAHKDIVTISAEMKKLAKLAKEKKLQPEQYQGGGFTISNLGMFGIKNFYPIINPPQACIMGVGGTQKVAAIGQNNEVCCKHEMNISLACDHRTVDGAVGAAFLNSFKEFLEKPLLMTKF
jgi:pyruvate dehydrogenase E2 component (dihydrolipoamide acetyltransferase)